AVLVGAVGVTAWDIVSAGRGLAQMRPATPELRDFPALTRVPLLPQKYQNPDLQRALKPSEDRLLRAVQNIAIFENARAEPTLRAAPAAVQAVVAGSTAAQAGLQPGDVLRTVNDKEAGFVWDVYKQATERPVRRLELAVQRGADVLAVSLDLPAGEQFDMTNLGLLFAVPSSARFIGNTDTARIAAQLRQAYLEPLPMEEQGAYTEGLLMLSNALVSNLRTLQAAAPGSGAYLRSEELLVWYHRQHHEAQSAFRIGLVRLQARQSQALTQMGWCLLACSAAGLLALALAMRRTWRP
ncbi:MAG: PDZ domain-containing protein, partial [Aquabacterium sp.]|nr:PDZ domain-containing protein [Aquabacterium sp.]